MLALHNHIVSVDAVVWVELLATTLAGKHMAPVLSHFVLARHLQRLESFVIGFVPPTLIPSSTNLPSTPAGPGASR